MESTRDIKILFRSKYRNTVLFWFSTTFGGLNNAEKALKAMLKENHSDETIYSLTHTYRKKYTDQHKKAEKRINRRFENRRNEIKNLITGIEYPKGIYLDIGCETMDETEMYGEVLGIEEVRCINISDWVGAYEENIHVSQDDPRFSYYDGVNIPYEDSSISVITMNMVIHHVSDDTKKDLLRNVYRVLEPGGIFIIREHDSFDDPEEKKYFDMFLDFIHHYFDSVINVNYRWVDDYHTTYTSAETLRRMLEEIGFESIRLIESGKADRSYHEIFRVIKD